MSLAIVGRIVDIEPHPNADRLEVIRVWYDTREVVWPVVSQCLFTKLVTGKHYRSGDFGVWLKPGAVISQEMARSLWMPAGQPFEVREIEMRGVPSPGLWCGQWYRNDKAVSSNFNADARNRGADRGTEDGWLHWKFFRDQWKVGDIVDDALGVLPVLGPPGRVI